MPIWFIGGHDLLYWETFQKHLHMEYISLSWPDIPELVVHNHDFLDSGLLLTSKVLNKVFLVVKLNPSLRKCRNRLHDPANRCNCVTTDLGYVPFVVIAIQSFPYSWLITEFVTRVRHLYVTCWAEIPIASGVRFARSLVFCVVFCRSL